MSRAIEVHGIWKKFRRGELHDSLRDLVPAVMRRLIGGRARGDALSTGEFWALQDVTFDVGPGEALGIIGPNGAGKSTMLKLLTKILRPTRGHCQTSGRVRALIEVAAGFHGDLSGRENIFLQGVIMGMKRAEIARKLEEIVEFAGVGAFVDTPVKRYSSGMNARLGFAVAAHLDPEVLLIDEVLAVGDMAFQEKCIQRMKLFKRQGVTIVFVSHHLQSVSDLCDTGLYLQGHVGAYGPTREVIASYLRSLPKAQELVEGAGFELCDARLRDASGRAVEKVAPGTRLILQVTYHAVKPVTDLTFGFILYRSTDRLLVYDGHVRAADLGIGSLAGGEVGVLEFAFRCHLTRGQYHIACHAFHNPTQRQLSRIEPAGIIVVDENQTYAGIADVELHPSVLVSSAKSAESPSHLGR
jgi:ABC-type polysaccharide/polyol phosphate transport system ATPase subunit